jgi:hypothetical protein
MSARLTPGFGAYRDGVYQARIGRHDADHFKLARIVNFDE